MLKISVSVSKKKKKKIWAFFYYLPKGGNFFTRFAVILHTVQCTGYSTCNVRYGVVTIGLLLTLIFTGMAIAPHLFSKKNRIYISHGHPQ